MESTMAPIVILATNRGNCEIRGTENILSPHGMPRDLLDRLVIIKTIPFVLSEIREILKKRCQVESIALSEEGLIYLSKIGIETTLRFCVQMLQPAAIIANMNEHEAITEKDVQQAASLFIDAKTSSKILAAQAGTFLP